MLRRLFQVFYGYLFVRNDHFYFIYLMFYNKEKAIIASKRPLFSKLNRPCDTQAFFLSIVALSKHLTEVRKATGDL